MEVINLMLPITRTLFLVSTLLAAGTLAQGQAVNTAGEIATITVGAIAPFTASCSVTDTSAGYKVIYPDRAQAAQNNGQQNLVFTTVGGSTFTVDRRIEEKDKAVSLTDTFPEEAAPLALAKTLNIEFSGADVADAQLEFVDGSKGEAGGVSCRQALERSPKLTLTCSGFKLTYPSGEKLGVGFEEPRQVTIYHVETAKKDSYLFRISYPDAPSKSTFEFRAEGK